jgi:hypothetical protein
LISPCEKFSKYVGSETKLHEPVEKPFFSPTSVPSEKPVFKPRTVVIPVMHTPTTMTRGFKRE